MSRINIIETTIADEAAIQLDVRIIMMPLYPATTPETRVFYGYYKAGDLRIEDSDAEGNSDIGDIVSADSKTNLLDALIDEVGAVTEATLLFHQLNDDAYVVGYKKTGEENTTITLTGSFFLEDNDVKDIVLTDLGLTESTNTWLNRKAITVANTTSQTDYPVTIIVYNTSGTDSSNSVYLDGKVRSDWGDIRIVALDETTKLPYAIVNETGTAITLTFLAPSLINGNTTFYIYYNKPALLSPYKIANLTDTHYDAVTDAGVDRTATLTNIDNFVSRMSTYLPDLAVNNGDKTGAGSAVEATQLSWYQSNMTHFAAVSAYATVVRDGVAPGNHDFEYIHFANTLALHSGETWMESGKMYGYWESADFRFIALDSNYAPGGQTHMDFTHQGFGYINTDQITWLTACLAASTKPVIIFCHHPLGEFDTTEISLTKETYHVQNRTAVRDVLEASGKVVCCLHGHAHWFRADVINGIPYLCMEDISKGGEFHELPVETQGKWTLFEIDTERKSIHYMQEYKIPSVGNELIFDYTIPYQTSFDSDVANFPEKVYAKGYAATFEKSSILLCPSQLYINNISYIWTEPPNIYLGDPRLSSRTVKIQGLTDAPNYGRATWAFAPQTANFRVRFSARLSSLKEKIIKVINTNVNTPAAYVYFSTGGDIIGLNGLSEITLQSYSINTWYEFDIKINTVANTYSVYINGVLKATNYAFYNSNSTLKTVEFVVQTGEMFIDNLRIEPFITTEPTISAWGVEENL